MSERITESQLKARIDRLNALTGNPTTSWIKVADGTLRAQIGNYHLDCAYGGYALSQMVNEGGGVRQIFSGYCSKRELANLLRAYMDGLSERTTKEGA